MTSTRRCRMRSWLPLVAGVYCLPAPPAAGAAAPAVAERRNPPDAFLPLPAANIESVLEQVHSNPVVRRHYARYFHVPPSRVATYLRANLVPSRLSRSGLYTVYFVRANGLIYPTLLTFPAGYPLFALKNGLPGLTWGEGNPLARTQKAVPLGAARPSPPPSLTAPMDQAPSLQIVVPDKVETTVVPPAAPGPSTEP